MGDPPPLALTIRSRDVVAAGVVFAIALAVRLPRYGQSLWCDEMGTLLDYVAGPWRGVVAAGAGQFVPNDHVLYSILAKVCLTLGHGGRVEPAGVAAAWVRLPSLVAGSLVPVALAWPLRRTAPASAGVLAALASVHPWLVADSAQARGYGLMLLLGVLATARLPTGGRRWPVAYGLLLAAAVYTVMVAAVLVVGHGIVVVTRRRAAVGSWVRGVTLAAGVLAVLYLPLAAGVVEYFRHPLAAPTDYADFATRLFRYAGVGQDLPRSDDPARDGPGPWDGPAYWAVPVAVIVAGTAAGRRRPELAAWSAAMGATTVVCLAVAVGVRSAGQVRFLPWCGVWACAATTAVLAEVGRRAGRAAMLAGVAGVVGWLVWVDVRMPPDQPVREAMAVAGRTAPPGAPIVVAFLTAQGSARLYAAEAGGHPVRAAPTPPDLAPAEVRAVRESGRRPWLVVSYEYLIHDARPDAWQYLNAHYRLVDRLPGRISPVAVYAPR